MGGPGGARPFYRFADGLEALPLDFVELLLLGHQSGQLSVTLAYVGKFVVGHFHLPFPRSPRRPGVFGESHAEGFAQYVDVRQRQPGSIVHKPPQDALSDPGFLGNCIAGFARLPFCPLAGRLL
jgi:hypothetical protein